MYLKKLFFKYINTYLDYEKDKLFLIEKSIKDLIKVKKIYFKFFYDTIALK